MFNVGVRCRLARKMFIVFCRLRSARVPWIVVGPSVLAVVGFARCRVCVVLVGRGCGGLLNGVLFAGCASTLRAPMQNWLLVCVWVRRFGVCVVWVTEIWVGTTSASDGQVLCDEMSFYDPFCVGFSSTRPLTRRSCAIAGFHRCDSGVCVSTRVYRYIFRFGQGGRAVCVCCEARWWCVAPREEVSLLSLSDMIRVLSTTRQRQCVCDV